MQTFSQLPPLARSYVAAVVVVGFATVLHSAFRLYSEPIGTQWLVLVALTLLTGSFTIKVPSITARISVSETFVFASVLLFGAAAGTLTVLLETLVISLWLKPNARSLYRMMFNVAAPAVSIWVSATLFFKFSGIEPYSNHSTPLALLFKPLALLTIIYFLSNSWLVAIALGLERHQSAIEIWWNNFIWLSVNYFSGASLAAVIVTYTRHLDISTLVTIIPLLVISYLTFRTAMARAEDSNQHLSELNRLYLSTIETLAMAIDAKDQITHGHIRRVQTYAVGLAHRVGVTDEKLIKAIEAASLLHDMGKLAVPEYILNKPGKLTPPEFEKMKLHATVGADILSAIAFPYPVVPIVRYHHEHWDGGGYPTGLKGTDIPIGARILSVVDCFDALTSDRPYRPRLADDEALAILLERRGSMYDPLIVDTFVRVHGEIAPERVPWRSQQQGLNHISSSIQAVPTARGSRPLDEVTASADEVQTLCELTRALTGQASLGDVGDVIARHLRRLIPSSLSVFYRYDPDIDELEAIHAVGGGASVVRGMRVQLGQRLSGWVAANRQTISNSDSMLDLGDAARMHSLNLRSCISTPLLSEDVLVGVLTLHSSELNAFNEDHRRIIEAVARQIAHTFKNATALERSSRRDDLTGLPNRMQLEQFVDATGIEHLVQKSAFALLFIDIIGFKQINALHGGAVGDEVLRHVVRHSTAGLRLADILFRYGSDDFVALLNETNSEAARIVARRIREAIRNNPLATQTSRSINIDVSVTEVTSPNDGASLAALIEAARLRTPGTDGNHEGSTIH